MKISLVRLSKVALTTIVFLTLILVFGAVILFASLKEKQAQMEEVLDLQRRISALSVAGDTMMLHGVEAGSLAAFQNDAKEIESDLRLLAENYPDAQNGIIAINRMVGMLEVAENIRKKARAADVAAEAPTSSTLMMDNLMSTMAAHGVALDAAVGEALDGRHEKLATEATWLVGGLSGFAVVFAGVSFLAFSLIYFRVGRPLQELANTIRAIESGKSDARAPEDRADELGDVGKAFNSLLSGRRADESRLQKSSSLVRLASNIANLGGWRYEIGNDRLEWTEGTARIHDLPSETNPGIQQAASYYKGKDQDRIRKHFDECISQGKPFDGIFELVTVAGREVTVRAVGEPEYDATGQISGVQGAFQDVTELIHVREKAARRSTQLRNVLAAIGDGFIAMDSDWRFTFMNQRAYELVDRVGEELIGHDIWEAFPEVRGTRFETLFHLAVAEGESQSFVEYLPSVQRWFEVNAHPTPDGLAFYFRDFTKLRETQVRLNLFEEAAEHLNDIVVITDAEKINGPEHPRIIYVNRAFERITGYSRDEAIGKTPRILQGPGTDRKTLDEIRDALENLTSVRTELVNYTKSGELLWLDLDIVPLTDQEGHNTHFVAVERDITERKRTEQKLRANEERLRLVSRVTTDFIWDWDVEKDAWRRTDEHLAALGLSPDTRATTFEETMAFIHPDDRDWVREDLMQAIDGTDESWEGEYRIVVEDGKPRQVVTRAAIVRDDGGRATRLVGGMSDVTEIRALDQQLHEAQKLESIGQLTGGVAHDFNNLLTIILGNTDMLLDRASDDVTRKLARATLEAAERGAQLTDSLLAFARRQPLKPEPTNVNDLIARSQTLLRKSIEEGIDLALSLAARSAVADVDPNRLQSAILNLVINSGHAIGERGTITVETDDAFLDHDYASLHAGVTPGRYVCISVSDDGIGMSPEVAEQAFEPFFTTRPLGEGTGLGLSSVYGFVKQSGGHSQIYSEPGKGTTIRLYLPTVKGDDTSKTREPAQTNLKGKSEEILVVEDHEGLRANVKSQLEGLGYRVREAANADEALRLLNEPPDVDLMFTDVVMPGRMNGLELAEEAQRHRPDLRVLFTSGYSRHAVVLNEKLDDGLRLLSKPYRLADLAKAVREALD